MSALSYHSQCRSNRDVSLGIGELTDTATTPTLILEQRWCACKENWLFQKLITLVILVPWIHWSETPFL